MFSPVAMAASAFFTQANNSFIRGSLDSTVLFACKRAQLSTTYSPDSPYNNVILFPTKKKENNAKVRNPMVNLAMCLVIMILSRTAKMSPMTMQPMRTHLNIPTFFGQPKIIIVSCQSIFLLVDAISVANIANNKATNTRKLEHNFAVFFVTIYL